MSREGRRRSPSAGRNGRRGPPGGWRWLLPAAWLGIVALAVVFVVSSWSWLPYVVIGLPVLLLVVWVLGSIFSPAVPDRTCPSCGGEGLVKIRRGEIGVRCELCGFRDERMHVAYLDEW